MDPFPLGILEPTGSKEGLLTLIGRGVTFDPSRWMTPRTYQYSFGFQRELPSNILVEASFAGNYQTFVGVDWGINEISMADYNQSRVDNSNFNALQVPNPFFDILPKNGGVLQDRRVFPGCEDFLRLRQGAAGWSCLVAAPLLCGADDRLSSSAFPQATQDDGLRHRLAPAASRQDCT